MAKVGVEAAVTVVESPLLFLDVNKLGVVVGLISGIVCVSGTGLWGGGVTPMDGLTVGKLEVGNGRH